MFRFSDVLKVGISMNNEFRFLSFGEANSRSVAASFQLVNNYFKASFRRSISATVGPSCRGKGTEKVDFQIQDDEIDAELTLATENVA